jgi:hypothetical protein
MSSPSKAISNLFSFSKLAFRKRGNQARGTITVRPSDKLAVNTSLLHFKLRITGYVLVAVTIDRFLV